MLPHLFIFSIMASTWHYTMMFNWNYKTACTQWQQQPSLNTNRCQYNYVSYWIILCLLTLTYVWKPILTSFLATHILRLSLWLQTGKQEALLWMLTLQSAGWCCTLTATAQPWALQMGGRHFSSSQTEFWEPFGQSMSSHSEKNIRKCGSALMDWQRSIWLWRRDKDRNK